MISSQTNEAFRELSERGVIAALPAPRSLGRGNADRKDLTRSSWLVVLTTGDQAKLTLGRDLSSLAARHAALAKACPDITTAQLAQVRLAAGEALLESFFDGPTLEAAASTQLLPSAVMRRAVADLGNSLAATEQASSESARATEWEAWTLQLLALPVWRPAGVALLRNLLLPGLYRQISSGPPVTRWSNGDFHPANILLNSNGESRLIDAEFAARTHFFAEDAVRFQVLSSAVQDQPDLFAGLLPERDLAWHLYFWLRQLQLETGQNTPAYLARVTPDRLGLIRRLAEHVLGVQLPDWSTPTLTVGLELEHCRWLLDTDRNFQISGWCHLPVATRLRAIIALGPGGRLATASPGARPDVQQHYNGEPRALLSGFALTIHSRPDDFPITLCAVIDNGCLVPFRVLSEADLPSGALFWNDYPAWASRHDPDPTQPATALPGSGPLFSVLLPVYKTPGNYLRDCVASVQAQYYRQWELCIVDDGSASPDLTGCLQQLAAADSRIRVHTRDGNGGISRATNDALAMARGEFVFLLDHDDLLRPHALAEFASRLAREPDLDALYSDEDKITAEGQRLIPLFKPVYSPEFLLGVMYIGHALGVRTSVARATGGFDPDFDGIQDYEFFLRVTEHTRKIGHIPRILYHWRQSPGSSALLGNVKGDMDQKQARAVQAHLRRRGDRRMARVLGGHRVRLDNPITPTMEAIPVSDAAAVMAALHQAATSSGAEVLVLLPAGQRSIPDATLADLAALAALPDSGCVTPVLLSPEGRVYESGKVGSVSIMRGFIPESDGYHGTMCCNREVDGVSPFCIAVRRALLIEGAGSPDEDWSGFCTRLRTLGLYHRVCATARVRMNAPAMTAIGAVPNAAGTTEFYNPHFDAQKGDYTLAAIARDRPAPEPGLHFYVDQPVKWDSIPRCLICRGWCFAGPEHPIAGIRLCIADQILTGIVGLSRPDVLAARPDARNAFTGFEIRGTLPAGRHHVRLEARLADGNWRQLMTQSVAVHRQLLPLWLGGGDWMELMFFQMPAHMAYPARPVRPEQFPSAQTNTPRPKLSIVTPSYNQARFLPETMRSVLEQPDVTCQYVVQDGESTDGSVALIKRLAEEGERRKENGNPKSEDGAPLPSPSSLLPSPCTPRLIAWASAPDAGQADAIVRAFAKTTGGSADIMAWINSDDFYLPGALSYVVDYFAQHPDVDVIYGHRIVVNEESQEIARWFLPKHDPAVLRLNDFVPQETLFWRRRIWDQTGGLDSSFKFALDWDLLLRFQAAGAKFVRVPCFLACFRVHAAQKTSARMHDVGQREITLLRERTQGRIFPPQELETHPRLLSYLRRSAFIEWLWKLGLRAP